MVKLNKSPYLPPLRLVEDTLTEDHIIRTLDTAFGKRDTVKSIRKRDEYTFVYLSPLNSYYSRPMREWDKFYEDLDEHGSLWVDFTKMAPDDYRNREERLAYKYNHPIEYSLEKKEGHWEIHYAIKNQGPRISTTSETPRYAPPPPRRSARFIQDKPIELPTVSVDLPPVATVIPDANSVCIVTVSSATDSSETVVSTKSPKKWYSCLFPCRRTVHSEN